MANPDTTPPSAAYNLVAIASPNVRVELSWSHANTPDVAFFKVYRATTPAGGGALVATTNGGQLYYYDAGVTTPNSYYHYVTAVDSFNNESASSNVAGAPYLSIKSRNMIVRAPTGGGYTGGATDVVPGSKLSYGTTYINKGFAPATNVVFTDWIPASSTFVPGSAVCSGTNTANFQHTPGGDFDTNESNVIQIRWTLQNDITPFNEGVVTFSVTVN